MLERRTELEAKARRLQLEEQFERSEQVQLPLQQGYLQQPLQHQWQPAQQGPLPVLWPVQGVPAGWPVQGVPSGWTGTQQRRAQAVQVYPEQRHAARLHGSAPPQPAWPPPPSGGSEQVFGGGEDGGGLQSGWTVPDLEGPPGNWRPGSPAQMGQHQARVPRSGREQPRPEAPSLRPMPRDPGQVAGCRKELQKEDREVAEVVSVGYDPETARRGCATTKWVGPYGPDSCQNVAAPEGRNWAPLTVGETCLAKALVGPLRHYDIVAMQLMDFIHLFDLQEEFV